jgi:DNA-binding CsgD family transcriptional regulator
MASLLLSSDLSLAPHARRVIPATGVLSPREREVVQLLGHGLTGEEIAASLFLSSETVRTHVRNAMTKLDARTRAHAVALALASAEIDPVGIPA